MIIYSKKIIKFVNEVRTKVKEILVREIRLKIYGERFYSFDGLTSYPISIVIYNNKSMLGYFDPNFYELGFHEMLMNLSKDQLHNIIRHELAHYMVYILGREDDQPHSPEFRGFCRSMGWGEEVYNATFDIEKGPSGIDACADGILRKVQKLMALSSSSNQNEAEQAMVKSQQLLLKHNLEGSSIPDPDDEKVFLIRILKQKREDAKMRSIAKILETFFVSVVYSRHEGFIYLEVLGNAVNVEIAKYVSGVLQNELENLWSQTQKLHPGLKGTIAKNSFFLGIARGYCNKIEALKKEYNGAVLNALVLIEKKIEDAQAMAYPRLRTTKSTRSVCQASSALGELMGKQLNINPAIHGSKNSGSLLTYKN